MGDDVAPREGLLQARALEQVVDGWIAAAGSTTPADIRSLPAVAGARRLIASTIDQLPLVVNSDASEWKWLADPRSTGGRMDLGDMIQFTVDSMILHGRAFWLVEATSEAAFRLNVLHPDWVQPYLIQQPGDVRSAIVQNGFRVRGQDVPTFTRRSMMTREQRARLTVEQRAAVDAPHILHIPYVTTVDYPAGTTPLWEAAQALRGFITTERHVAELFDQGTHHGGVLSTAHDLTVGQAQQWQAAWIDARKSGRIPVLGNGLEYHNDTPNSRDLQLVEARMFNQSAVWALLGIPQAYMGSSLMGGQSSLSYSNAQDNRRQFADNCLRAFTTQIEDAVSRLLPPGRNSGEQVRARFDYTEWEGRSDGTTDVAEPAAAGI